MHTSGGNSILPKVSVNILAGATVHRQVPVKDIQHINIRMSCVCHITIRMNCVCILII